MKASIIPSILIVIAFLSAASSSESFSISITCSNSTSPTECPKSVLSRTILNFLSSTFHASLMVRNRAVSCRPNLVFFPKARADSGILQFRISAATAGRPDSSSNCEFVKLPPWRTLASHFLLRSRTQIPLAESVHFLSS